MKTRSRKTVKRVVVCVVAVIAAILVTALSYFAYVFAAYYRVEDDLELKIETGGSSGSPQTGTEYRLMSFNIGFGAYEPDYGFFMDGGTQSRAWSPERLNANIDAISQEILKNDADFVLLQEVDIDGTRTYHYDERAAISAKLAGYSEVWAQNYDSPYLFYPLTEPIGANKSGIITYSRFTPSSSVRRSLPVESGVRKLLDLDRCYSVTRFPLENGRELVLVNLHLSAYTADGVISDEQVELIADEMSAEYKKGNYVICGGDFNKNLLSPREDPFKASQSEYSWAKYFPVEKLAGTGLRLVAPLDEVSPVPSCRNADGPYTPNQFVVTIDGFIVSDNVSVKSCGVVDTGFKYSDHNPVQIVFELK